MPREWILTEDQIIAMRPYAYEAIEIDSYTIQLHGIRYSFFPDNYVRIHSHTFCEFNYVTEGCLRTIANNLCCEYKPGQFALLIPGLLHEHPPGLSKYLTIRFEITRDSSTSVNPPQSDLILMQNLLKRITHETMTDIDGRLWKSWQNLVRRAMDGASKYEWKLLMAAFIRQILSCYESILPPVHVGNEKGRDTMLVNAAMKYIEEHCTTPISAQDVAASIYISYSHLARLFTQRNMPSISQQILIARIDHAQHLLLTTDLPIGVISECCCFKYVSHFTRQFVKLAGMTPTAYRNSRGNNKELL